MDRAFDKIRAIQQAARGDGTQTGGMQIGRDGSARNRPIWPMIILRSPKGWTGPKTVDSLRAEGFWRSHLVPSTMDTPEHLQLLDGWLRSYRPEELFDDADRPIEAIASLAPLGDKRMSANPHANGGILMRPLWMPDFAAYAVTVPSPGAVDGEATHVRITACAAGTASTS